MQLVLGRLAGNKSEKSQFYQSFNQSFNFISILYSRVSEVTLGPFLVFFVLRFGHEIRCCFAVADASQSDATCAWQARWPQN